MSSLADYWRAAWSVPDRRPIYDWAAEGNLLLPPVYTLSGAFHVELSRQLIEVFDALADDRVTMVTVIAPPRTGKSMLADIWVPSVIVRDPGPVMWNLQTDKIAKDYSEERVHPLLKFSPALKPLWPLDKHHASIQRILFLNGVHLYVQGPSIGNLQTKGIRYQVNDETWLWKPGRIKEAHARTADFHRIGTDKILNLSQGSWEGDDTHALWTAGDQCEWATPCLHCGHYMVHVDFQPRRPDGSRWGLKWDKPTRGRLDHRTDSDLLGQILPTVRFECEKCGQTMTDSARVKAEWNRLGKYVPQKTVSGSVSEPVSEKGNEIPSHSPAHPLTHLPSGSLPSGRLPSGRLPSGSLPSGSLPSGSLPSGSLPSGSLPSSHLPTHPLTGSRSFRWPGLIHYSWAELVQDFIKACDAYDRGVIELLTEFVQKKVPDFWSEARLLRADPMTRETFDVRAKWDGEFARVLTIDRQADGLHWGLVCAWSRNGEARRLWFGQLFSETEIEAKQLEWQIPAHRVLIDSGFEPRLVYAMCVRHGWIALKGDPTENFTVRRTDRYGKPCLVRSTIADPVRADPEIGKPLGRSAPRTPRYATLIRFSHPATQDTVKRLLQKGRLICPTDGDELAEEEFQRQMKAEFPIIKVDQNGRRRRVWICPSGNNHLRDCFAMQVVAAKLLKVLPDELSEERLASDAKS